MRCANACTGVHTELIIHTPGLSYKHPVHVLESVTLLIVVVIQNIALPHASAIREGQGIPLALDCLCSLMLRYTSLR